MARDDKKGKSKGDWWEKVPGCEKAKLVQDTKASECCPGLPQIFSKEAWSNCSSSCKKNTNEHFCCISDCILTFYKVADDKGKFDPAKAKEVLKSSVNNDDKWVSYK